MSSAFLQGDYLEDGLTVIPTPEICEALGVPEGSVTKLQRAAYGLVEAPLWWYKNSDKIFHFTWVYQTEIRSLYLDLL